MENLVMQLRMKPNINIDRTLYLETWALGDNMSWRRLGAFQPLYCVGEQNAIGITELEMRKVSGAYF